MGGLGHFCAIALLKYEITRNAKNNLYGLYKVKSNGHPLPVGGQHQGTLLAQSN
jgi:hypothetical protein